MKKRGKREFFLEPLDNHTNQIIVCELPEHEALRTVWGRDGQPRDVRRCSYRQVQMFCASQKKDSRLSFYVFTKYPREDKIYPWSFSCKKRPCPAFAANPQKLKKAASKKTKK